jgi:hypothetical protein
MRKFLAVLTLSLAVVASHASDASAQWRRGYSGGAVYTGAYTPWTTWNSGYSSYYSYPSYISPSYGYSSGYYSNYNYYTPSYSGTGTYYPVYNHPTFRSAGYPQYGWRPW